MRRRTLLSVIAAAAAGVPLEDYGFEGTNWPVGTQDGNMHGVCARVESTRLWLVGLSSDSVWNFTKSTGANASNIFPTTGITTPFGLIYDGVDLWIPDNESKDYESFTLTGTKLATVIDTSPQMSDPTGGDIDPADGTFWLSNDTGTAYKFDSSRVYTGVSIIVPSSDFEDLAHDDQAGTLWMLGRTELKLFEFAKDGIATGNEISLGASGITGPAGVGYDPFETGVLWVVCRNTDRVYKFKRGV